MDPLLLARSRPALVVGACGALIGITTAVALAQDGAGPQSAPPALPGPVIELVSGVPDITSVDLRPKGKTTGDMYVFASRVRTTDGDDAGRLRGTQTTIRLGRAAEIVQGESTYDLPDGQIAVGGDAAYPRQGKGFPVGEPQVRAVLGGTGRYAGASGTVTATRLQDGTYRHRIELVPARERVARDFGVVSRQLGALGLRFGTRARDGDMRVFAAVTRKPEGLVLGTQTLVEIEDDADVHQAAITYDLRGGQLAVGGLSRLPTSGEHLVRGQAFARPVLGGTGRYAGMAGTVTSTRVSERRTRSRFELHPAGRRGPTIRVRSLDGPSRHLDLGAKGPSAGDLTVFWTALASRKGNPAGAVEGFQTTIRRRSRSLSVGGHLTFQLRRGDIVVGGLSAYPLDASGTMVGQTFVRPVLGGTGAYAGMRGTLRTTRRADDTYDQVFRLRAAG